MTVYMHCDGGCGAVTLLGMTDGWSQPHERDWFRTIIRDLCPACQDRERRDSMKKVMDEAWARVQEKIGKEKLEAVGKSLTEVMQMRLRNETTPSTSEGEEHGEA